MVSMVHSLPARVGVPPAGSAAEAARAVDSGRDAHTGRPSGAVRESPLEQDVMIGPSTRCPDGAPTGG
jgi:hypothetical protein